MWRVEIKCNSKEFGGEEDWKTPCHIIIRRDQIYAVAQHIEYMTPFKAKITAREMLRQIKEELGQLPL